MPRKLKELTSMSSNMILREDLIYRKTDYDLLAHEYDVQLPVTHSQILMMRKGGGVQQRFIFYTQKNHNFKIFLPKKIPTFLAYQKKSLSPFFASPKNSSVIFRNPKKSRRLS